MPTRDPKPTTRFGVVFLKTCVLVPRHCFHSTYPSPRSPCNPSNYKLVRLRIAIPLPEHSHVPRRPGSQVWTYKDMPNKFECWLSGLVQNGLASCTNSRESQVCSARQSCSILCFSYHFLWTHSSSTRDDVDCADRVHAFCSFMCSPL